MTQKLLKKFSLIFSKSAPGVEPHLSKHAANIPKSEVLSISKNLYEVILKTNEEIKEYGIPKHLALAHVNDQVNMGIFLKPDEKPLRVGTFIGIYTGLYELVPTNVANHTCYAYDIVSEIQVPGKKTEYSVQTNADSMGNFTRFINHSSLETNVEAIVAKLPDGRLEVLLFALKRILPGQQLLSSYGGVYWKALHVVPDDMKPDTYLLNSKGKAILSHPIETLPESFKKQLEKIRDPFPELPEEIKKTSLFKKLKKTLKKPSPKQKKCLDAFEEIVHERGLPRNMASFTHLKESTPKNTFLGVLSGTFSLTPKKSSILLAKSARTALYLTPKGPFASLKQGPGNLKIKLVYSDTLYPILFTSKEISPEEELSLEAFKVFEG